MYKKKNVSPNELVNEKKIIIEMLKTGIQIIKNNYDVVHGVGSVDKMIDERGFPPSVTLNEILPREAGTNFLNMIEQMAKQISSDGCRAVEIDFIIIPTWDWEDELVINPNTVINVVDDDIF